MEDAQVAMALSPATMVTLGAIGAATSGGAAWLATAYAIAADPYVQVVAWELGKHAHTAVSTADMAT